MIEVEKKLSTLLIGVDTLYEGDIASDDQADRNVADAWFSDEPLPDIYFDEFSKEARDFAKKKGSTNILEDEQAVKKFVEKYNLEELYFEIYSDKSLTDGARTNMLNLSTALDVILREFLSKYGSRAPTYDEKYIAATADVAGHPKIYDPTESRENLRKHLSSVGYETSSSRNLRETLLAWRNNRGIIKASDLAGVVTKVRSELLQKMRYNVLSKLDFNGAIDGVSFDSHSFVKFDNQDFTGYNTYKGGTENGKPALVGIFGYNTDHAPTLPEMTHITSHEVTGHYLNGSVRDLLYRNKKLEFLSTVIVMCTPMAVFQEGWAQNIFEIIYGSREKAADEYGKDLLVALAMSDLHDIGKHNVSILYQREGKSLNDVKRYLADDCVQPDHYVDKLSRGWTTHKLIGPMYGPSYLIGRTVVNDAIKKHGNLTVAEIGYHLKGYVDIGTFQDKVSRL